ncbi:major facilitator superfamily domain-containing protein [Emericellopsis atlantica]|uniref:Major facilitator superfamily domain-containing protein n=1 Tax=Emericellopsis atlantica TaxID=2614577 RepID=A0A9P7ZLR2_9HYPO|nr:major facilitator superfamily domain-containing protein [Emericellopsis atlantica]KAG9254434.1 major facilitator superfamily domain-containing protein [Emericellopsis atlantica]
MAALETQDESSKDRSSEPMLDVEHWGPGLDMSGLDGLTLYEKKCVLVNREIDHQGMGKYQWYIWGLCGFGYFLDLLWAHAFGLVLSPLQQEMGFGNDESGNISVCFNAGLTAGAFFWGFMSDIVGRKWAFNLTCLFSSIFGLCLGASPNYLTFLVLTAFVGFGVGGNIPIDTSITLEFIPQNKRFLLACLSVFQPLGVVVCSAIAFGFIPVYSCSPNFSEKGALKSCKNVAEGVECCSRDNNMGWRYLLFTLGAVTVFIFFLRYFVFHFRETPKFLIFKGKDAEAIQVLEHMAKTNKRECRLSLEVFEAMQSEHDSINSASTDSSSHPVLGGGAKQLHSNWKKKSVLELDRYKMLFDGFQMSRLTILVWLTYIMDFWGFTVAGFYLPRILALKNGAAEVSLTTTYAAYIYTYAPGIVGVLFGAWMYKVPSVGQKWTMVISSGLMGASIILFSTVDTVAKNQGIFAMEYFFQSMFNAVLYGWTPQAFPAPVRGTACGVASFWGRLFGIVSPLIAQSLYGRGESADGDINSVLYLAGGVTLGCVITTALLPNKLMETKDERS